MKILIVSALYPPDVEAPAPYIKELATRLAATHTMSILTYGTWPEAIAKVAITAVPKHLPAFIRLFVFTKKLFLLARQADVVLLQNAPSTELPAIFVGLIYRSKFYLQTSDQKIIYTGWRAFIHRLIARLAPRAITAPLPEARPEIHPFNPPPPAAMEQYEQSWQQHLAVVHTHLS